MAYGSSQQARRSLELEFRNDLDTGPQRFSVILQAFSFLFRGSRGDISLFQTELSEIMKGDELLISAKGLQWREVDVKLPITSR